MSKQPRLKSAKKRRALRNLAHVRGGRAETGKEWRSVMGRGTACTWNGGEICSSESWISPIEVATYSQDLRISQLHYVHPRPHSRGNRMWGPLVAPRPRKSLHSVDLLAPSCQA